MTIEGSFNSVNYGIVTVDSHYSVAVRDGETEGLYIELPSAIQKPEDQGLVNFLAFHPAMRREVESASKKAWKVEWRCL